MQASPAPHQCPQTQLSRRHHQHLLPLPPLPSLLLPQDIEEARFLANLCPDLVHGHATGIFFDRDKTEEGTVGDTGGVINSTYYGETPLGFAVSTAQAAMVTFLVMERGAKISEADVHGNTAAHMAVSASAWGNCGSAAQAPRLSRSIPHRPSVLRARSRVCASSAGHPLAH